MPDESSASNSLFDYLERASRIATPFVQAFSGRQVTGDETIDGRIRANRLNGSGPNNAAMARQAPASMLDQLFGRDNSLPGSAGGGTGWLRPVLGFLALALLLWLVFRRR